MNTSPSDELIEKLGDDEDFHAWQRSRLLTSEDVDKLAEFYDRGELHCLKRQANPHDD